MRASSLRPRVQLFVCTHVRGAEGPLRSGCGAAGPEVFATLKRATAGIAARVWVTATGCLGHCPGSGCAVVIYPHNEHLVEVIAEDAPAVLTQALGGR